MIKKSVENMTNLRTSVKGKGFKDFSSQKECKVKLIIAKQPLLIRAQL